MNTVHVMAPNVDIGAWLAKPPLFEYVSVVKTWLVMVVAIMSGPATPGCGRCHDVTILFFTAQRCCHSRDRTYQTHLQNHDAVDAGLAVAS
jgi:hypothetical protein